MLETLSRRSGRKNFQRVRREEGIPEGNLVFTENETQRGCTVVLRLNKERIIEKKFPILGEGVQGRGKRLYLVKERPWV